MIFNGSVYSNFFYVEGLASFHHIFALLGYISSYFRAERAVDGNGLVKNLERFAFFILILRF